MRLNSTHLPFPEKPSAVPFRIEPEVTHFKRKQPVLHSRYDVDKQACKGPEDQQLSTIIESFFLESDLDRNYRNHLEKAYGNQY